MSAQYVPEQVGNIGVRARLRAVEQALKVALQVLYVFFLKALLDGVVIRKVPIKGFKVVIYISFPFPKLLGAPDASLAATFELVGDATAS